LKSRLTHTSGSPFRGAPKDVAARIGLLAQLSISKTPPGVTNRVTVSLLQQLREIARQTPIFPLAVMVWPE
jgi:hypothetical protein